VRQSYLCRIRRCLNCGGNDSARSAVACEILPVAKMAEPGRRNKPVTRSRTDRSLSISGEKLSAPAGAQTSRGCRAFGRCGAGAQRRAALHMAVPWRGISLRTRSTGGHTSTSCPWDAVGGLMSYGTSITDAYP
jgi:hypothetical protein